MKTDDLICFLQGRAARHELITSELASIELMEKTLEDGEDLLKERQAQLDRDREMLAAKREQLRLWRASLEPLKQAIAEQLVSDQLRTESK